MEKLREKIKIAIGDANNQIQINGEQDDYMCGYVDALEWVLRVIKE